MERIKREKILNYLMRPVIIYITSKNAKAFYRRHLRCSSARKGDLAMTKHVKHFLFVFLLTAIFFTGTVFAAEEESGRGLWEWTLENVNLGHLGVSFEFGDFLPAQEARAVLSSSADISEEDRTEITIDFTIEDGQKEYDLPLPEGSFLEGGERYCLTIYGQNGEEASKYGEVECGFSAEVFFELNQVEIDYVSDCRITRAVAEMGSVEYEGTVLDDTIVISYPAPGNVSAVTVKIYDEYGCVRTYTGKTELPYTFGYTKVYAFPDGIRFTKDVGVVKFSEDERMAVKAGEKIYYTEYGYSLKMNGDIGRIQYPALSPGERVTVWMENKNGNITLKKKFTVRECEFYEGTGAAYPEMLTGQVSKGYMEQTPTKVRVRVGGKAYESDVDQNGRYTVTYPEQPAGTELSYDFLDGHGCCLEHTARVLNEFTISDNYDIAYGICDITETAVYAKSRGRARLCVKIGQNVYKGSFQCFFYNQLYCVSVSYPKQKPGTAITVWYEDPNTSKSAKKNFQIPAPVQAKLVDIIDFTDEGIVFEPCFYLDDPDEEIDIQTACAYINGKKYKGKQEDDFEPFRIEYSAKVGDIIKIVITDWSDNAYEIVYQIPQTAPEIYINRVESGSSKVTGDTEGRAAVTVKAGKKTYKTTAKKDGSFSVKIKPQKAGTKITVSVKTKKGATGTETTKVKQAKGTISLSRLIYRDSGKISFKVTGAYKGDIVTVKIGGKTYKKKLKSEKRTQKVTVSIHPASAGSKVKVTYSDRFKKKKNYTASVVYFGNAIYVGMSAKDACLTTWGKPRRKYRYGNVEQWVFVSKRSTLYVYVQGGAVTSMQRIDY